jgi:hypothetical protein
MTRRPWIVALALVTLAPLAGCGDNRSPAAPPQVDASVPADSGPATVTSITFAPDEGSHANAIWLELVEARPAEKTFTLRVVGAGIDAYGVAGRLLFDTAVTTLGEGSAGEALAGGDAELLAAAAGNAQGGYFGVSRSLGERVAVTLAADQPIGTLSFAVHGPGRTRIRFNAVRSLVIDAAAQPVPVGGWLGGTLTVR